MRDDQLMQHNDFTSAREKVTPSQDMPGHEKQVTVEVWPGHMLVVLLSMTEQMKGH